MLKRQASSRFSALLDAYRIGDEVVYRVEACIQLFLNEYFLSRVEEFSLLAPAIELKHNRHLRARY